MKKSRLMKKVFSGILPLAFLFVTLCPDYVAQSAAPSTIQFLKEDGSGLDAAATLGNTQTYDGKIANSAGTANQSKGTISYSAGTLTLDGVDIKTDNGVASATGTGATDELVVELKGTNNIVTSKAAFSITSCSIKFIGDGSLTVTEDTAGSIIATGTAGNITFASTKDVILNQTVGSAGAVGAAGNIVIDGGRIIVNQGGASNAVGAGGSFTMNGGSLATNQTATGVALKSGSFTMNDGTLVAIQSGTAGNAIDVTGAVAVKKGSITARVVDTASSGVLFKMGSSFTVDGGEITLEDFGTGNGYDVTGAVNINGGVVGCKLTNANSSAVPFKATGAFNVKGGSVPIITNGKGNGLEIGATSTFDGGEVSVAAVNPSTAIPIKGSAKITINGAKVVATGYAQSPYGIDAEVELNKGVVEAYGNNNGINPASLTLKEDIAWTALAGDSAATATKLQQTKGAEVVKALADNGYDYVKLYNASTLDPSASTFDQYAASNEHTEITVGLDLNGNKLTGIALGDTELILGEQFMNNTDANGNVISTTFQVREFLDTLSVGKHTLKFNFDNGTSADFVLTVVDTTQTAGDNNNTDNNTNNGGNNNASNNGSTTTKTEQTQKDQLPKTGDESSIMPYILLFTAGLFTIIIAAKKKYFCK